MILGKIFGKITTTHFKFLIEKETKKFEFVQVLHKVYDYVLCQVVEIEAIRSLSKSWSPKYLRLNL